MLRRRLHLDADVRSGVRLGVDHLSAVIVRGDSGYISRGVARHEKP